MATNELNQFMEDINEQVLECTICLNRIQMPTSLSCHHSFCLPCLKKWVRKNKGVLTCPTCSRSEPIPEGGLEKLQPNIFLNNLLETMGRFEKRNKKCVCGGQAKYYCQECRHNLCSMCSDHHKLLPMLANHPLHNVKDVQSMTPQQFASLNPPMCSLHSKKLEFYCDECKVPTCVSCIITEHRVWEGKHTSISISDAFKRFKQTAAELEEASLHYKNKLQDGLNTVIENDKKLKQNKDNSLKDIEHHIQEMMNIIIENGEKMKNSINTMYKQKKQVNDKQMNELKLEILDVNTNLSFLYQIIKSDEATAMQSSENVTKALKDTIKESRKTEPEDNGELCFVRNNYQFDSLKQSDIGSIYVVQMPTDCFILNGPDVVTQGQIFDVNILKTAETEIDANQLDVTWTDTEETDIIEVKETENGDHIVRVRSAWPGIHRLYVNAGGKPIKHSPMRIKVEKEGLINTININGEAADVVKCEDGCLLVSCLTNKIYKYKPSGEYINEITLPEDVKIRMMHKMINGNIVFSDTGRKCIKVCNMDGLVMKSIGEGILDRPCGIHVDEASNVVYVADYFKCVLFNLHTGKLLKKIIPQGTGNRFTFYDITITRNGNLLVVDYYYDQILLFDNEVNFLKVLISRDEFGYLEGAVVDQEDNIIISCEMSVMVFSMDGTFIKQINEDEDGIEDARQLTILSYYPRQIAVANGNEQNIKIFNY